MDSLKDPGGWRECKPIAREAFSRGNWMGTLSSTISLQDQARRWLDEIRTEAKKNRDSRGRLESRYLAGEGAFTLQSGRKIW